MLIKLFTYLGFGALSLDFGLDLGIIGSPRISSEYIVQL